MQNYELIAFPIDAAHRHFNPLYGETRERLLRMSLVDVKEKSIPENISALCIPLAATLYDNLLEYGEDIAGICETLAELYSNQEITGMYLYLCLLYGQLDEIVPEPLQWLSGHREALFIFCEVLLEHMACLLLEDGFIFDDENDGSEQDNVIPIKRKFPNEESRHI